MYLINPSFLDLAKNKLNIKTSNYENLLKLRDESSTRLIDIVWREYPQMKSLTVYEIQEMGYITLEIIK